MASGWYARLRGISGGSRGEEVRELEQELGGRIFDEMLSRWKEKVIAAAEKVIGRKMVTERLKGWWSEDVVRFIVIRKMKEGEARKKRIRGGYT